MKETKGNVRKGNMKLKRKQNEKKRKERPHIKGDAGIYLASAGWAWSQELHQVNTDVRRGPESRPRLCSR